MAMHNRADNLENLTSVSTYGSHIAKALHNYVLLAEYIPTGLEGSINIIDATVSTLNQVLTFVEDGPEFGSNDERNEILSGEGLSYVQTLVKECAATFWKVTQAVDEGCLGRTERRALQKQKRKQKHKPQENKVDLMSLSLDEKEFLEKVEKTCWLYVEDEMDKAMDRLYELQLHLLLVSQVATLSSLSRKESYEVDIKNIVTFHSRIKRTASLVGIKVPGSGRPTYGRRDAFISDEFLSDTSSSSSSSSSSDSDSGGKPSGKRNSWKKKAAIPCAAPTPPPPPKPSSGGVPPPPPPPVPYGSSHLMPPAPPMGLSGNLSLESVIETKDGNPPTYSESRKMPGTTVPATASESTLLGVASTASPKEKQSFTDLNFPAEKSVKVKNEDESKKPKAESATTKPPAQLFKSKTTGFGFKLRTLFRSKESLAEEMRRTLKDSESQLSAFVIQNNATRQVPHSAFHSLESTHMSTVLSQINSNDWYSVFTKLDCVEHNALDRILRPWHQGKIQERELLVLKIVQEKRLNAWIVLLSEILRNQPFPRGTGRVVLAICREKIGACGNSTIPPPPPTAGKAITPKAKAMLRVVVPAPPLPYFSSQIPHISDLSSNQPPGSWLRGSMPTQQTGVVPVPPHVPTYWTTPELREAMTKLVEFTVRPVCSDTESLKSWNRVSVNIETNEQHLVQQRVQQYERGRGNVLETKLRLTTAQSCQAARVMDNLRVGERDSRFEWCWVEISLHTDHGEILDLVPRGPGNHLTGATMMHLIAKRTLMPSYTPSEVYRNLLRATPFNPTGNPLYGGDPPRPPSPAIINVSKRPSRRYSSPSYFTDSEDSDSSVGNVRRRVRRHRARKDREERAKTRRRRSPGYGYNSDLDSGSDSDDEDVIEINLELKRHDQVVNKLMDLWIVPNVEKKQDL